MTPESHAALLKALSTERRIQILQLLMTHDSPVAAGVLAAKMDLSEGAISFNAGKLAEVGLLTKQASGRHVFYSPNKVVIRELIRFWRTKPKE